MNDQEIIRKAVELAASVWTNRQLGPTEVAEVWRITKRDDGSYWGHIKLEPMRYQVTFQLNDVPQYVLDALAAQLVRQIEDKSLLYCYHIEALKGSVAVLESHGSCDTYISEVFGEDRTMNTLRAIVESKVLE